MSGAGAWDAITAAPFGRVALRLVGQAVAEIDLLGEGALQPPRGPAARRVAQRIASYLEDPHTPLDLALAVQGTVFRQRVWAALRRIPVGATRRYGDLARELHTSARAVGGACRANPTPLLVPCHRVVAGGDLGGFCGATAGAEVERKRWLLRHEGAWPERAVEFARGRPH